MVNEYVISDEEKGNWIVLPETETQKRTGVLDHRLSVNPQVEEAAKELGVKSWEYIKRFIK